MLEALRKKSRLLVGFAITDVIVFATERDLPVGGIERHSLSE